MPRARAWRRLAVRCWQPAGVSGGLLVGCRPAAPRAPASTISPVRLPTHAAASACLPPCQASAQGQGVQEALATWLSAHKTARESLASDIAKASAKQGARACCRSSIHSARRLRSMPAHCGGAARRPMAAAHGWPSSAACAPPCSAMARRLRRLEACSRPELTSGHPRLSAPACFRPACTRCAAPAESWSPRTSGRRARRRAVAPWWPAGRALTKLQPQRVHHDA